MTSTDPLIIGRFQVQYLLGRTPSHLIYLARDPHQKRPVTLTTALEGADPRKTARQFQQEWDISRRLDHPGIQKVLDRGSHPQFGPFLIKEYLRGVNLAVLLEDRLPPQATLHLLVQLAHALQAAVDAGVVHGDIKPENVLVDFEGHLTLLDFHAGTQESTAPGPLSGSPGYVAPELLKGEPPSPRSDLFSFAVTAFQMWTGSMPFGAGDAAAMLRATSEKEPSFPSDMSISMRMVFQSALEKNPNARTQDLRTLMTGLITSANLPPPLTEELQALLAGKHAGIRGLAPFLARHVQVKGPQAEASPVATRPLGRPASPRNVALKVALALSLLLVVVLQVWRWLPRRTTVAATPPAAPVVTAAPAIPPPPSSAAPAPRIISVRTEPSGAELYLDGRAVGHSPQERLEIGKAHQLLVRLEGFEERKLDLDGEQAIPEPIQLEPSPGKKAVPARKQPAPKEPRKDEFNLYEHLRKQEGR